MIVMQAGEIVEQGPSTATMDALQPSPYPHTHCRSPEASRRSCHCPVIRR
jgi:hypothetical protein